jgi:hypothetical protein
MFSMSLSGAEAVSDTAAVCDIARFPSRPILLSLAHSCEKSVTRQPTSEAVNEENVFAVGTRHIRFRIRCSRFIHALDHSREFSEDAYRLAGEPKELVIVPNAGHVDLYDRVQLIPFDKLTSFFTEHLK